MFEELGGPCLGGQWQASSLGEPIAALAVLWTSGGSVYGRPETITQPFFGLMLGTRFVSLRRNVLPTVVSEMLGQTALGAR